MCTVNILVHSGMTKKENVAYFFMDRHTLRLLFSSNITAQSKSLSIQFKYIR